MIMLLALLGTGAAYGAAVLRLYRRGDRWPVIRAVAVAAGLACVAAAVLPPIATHDERFPVHVCQHLLLAGLAPLLLVRSAPVTLALRTLPAPPRRLMLGLLHRRWLRLLTHPSFLLVLVLGPMYTLYLTPLFGVAEAHPLLHDAVHAHMLLAGCLLAEYVVGVDPLPGRAGVRARAAVLFLSAAAHDTLAKLMYAGGLPAGAGSAAEVHTGARLLFYGGDAVEVLTAVVLFGTWYAATGRDLARQARRRPLTPAAAASAGAASRPPRAW